MKWNKTYEKDKNIEKIEEMKPPRVANLEQILIKGQLGNRRLSKKNKEKYP